MLMSELCLNTYFEIFATLFRTVLSQFSDIIRNVVEVLNDITKSDETGAPIE